ncbi:MAG: D-alanine--D-alanine ligase [Nonlabens sp.]|uniref:D-alanine--D-alanine ligase n=1 Tax=Nonlabens sp. TaxID=1888209 RepID=UPI003EF49C05
MKNIAVLMGGYSHEWQISLKSGAVISENIDRSKYNVFEIAILEEGWYYTDAKEEKHFIDKNDFSITVNGEHITFDCAYNTIHGTPGEDGIFQSYLELLGIPQTSCDSYQSAITFNKRDCIAVLKPWNITTGKHIYLNKDDAYDSKDVAIRLGLPYFVKANRSGSSFGVSKVYKTEELDAALQLAFEVDTEAIIESFLDGIEVSVGIYKIDENLIVLPPTEIISENDFFDYEAKYSGRSQEITPARISPELTQAVQVQTKRIYEVLNCKGIARADFIFHNGIPHFIEINTNPGMSKESIIPQQIRATGRTLKEVFTAIIENTIKYHS